MGSTSTLGLAGSGNGNIITGSGGTTAFMITNVLKDNANPTSVFDILGDGTSAMAQYCVASSSSSSGSTGSNTGASTCSCTYSYTSPSVGSQQVDVDTIYFESNMVECPYTSIPGDVSSVSIKIHVVKSDTYTNALTFNLAAAGVGTSPTSANSFGLVNRIQCKDVVTIPYPFGPNLDQANSVYDPIQSEDPTLSYPLDFYTTNIGGAYAQYVASGVKNWNCPANPQDVNFPSNYKLYSVGPDSGGSKQIYPTAGSAFDRSNFYVAKQPAGVFNVPLNAYVAPTLTASAFASSGNNPLLGYGASPIPSGASQETCPNTVPIPSGYHWVKVWLFRADLPDRRFVASSGLANLGTVICNPGTWGAGATGGKVFDDCGNTGGIGINNGGGGATLVDRVLAGEASSSGSPMCVQLDPNTAPNSSGPGYTTNVGGTTQKVGYTSLPLGTDRWLPAANVPRLGSTLDPTNATLVPYDPMDLGGRKWGLQFIPKDEQLTTIDIDQNVSQGQSHPRYDFVFVVTSPTVMAANMENSSLSSNYPYIPFRFPNASDCQSGDPDAPAFAGDCDPSKIIHYGLKLHDVSSNGDPSASDPNRAGVFPMCALQPN